ncbi:hypothetical protein FXF53_20540 [Micromonospora sp. WP24]|uniref:hypothetical protein n=1 Tax=Micromonospora sp. WP24 TaxID=2604469 RepID=UPI0011D4BA3B|nr:hypothetical protein [Micromonospora sp. WP24]TYB97134.1 hypothetical protein FXF53_20540 [Micromonospora sp. WP24]
MTIVEVEKKGGTDYDSRDPWGPGGPSATSWEYDWETRSRFNRSAPVYCFLDDLVVPRPPANPKSRPPDAWVQCRCRTVRVSGAWLKERIDAGRRRAVFD